MYANDELKQPEAKKVYILNLQNSDQGGSHWTLLYNGYYFDPFGTPPTKAIQPFVRSYNPFQFQKFTGESCGYFCMYVAENIFRGLSPTQHLIPLEVAHNENLLKQYFV